MENACWMKNEIGKIINSSPVWVQKTKKDLEKITGAIKLIEHGSDAHIEQVSWISYFELAFVIKDYVYVIELQHKKEIRQLELELAQLAPDDDLQEHAMKMRELQQEINNRNKIIKQIEDKVNAGGDGDTDDNEDKLIQKICEVLEASERSEQSESSDDEPTKRDSIQSKKGKVWFWYRLVSLRMQYDFGQPLSRHKILRADRGNKVFL